MHPQASVGHMLAQFPLLDWSSVSISIGEVFSLSAMIKIFGGLCGMFLVSTLLLNVGRRCQRTHSVGEADGTLVNPFEAENLVLKERYLRDCEYRESTKSMIHTLRVEKAILEERNHLDHRRYHAQWEKLEEERESQRQRWLDQCKQESEEIEAKVEERMRAVMEDEHAKITSSYHSIIASHERTIKDLSDKLAKGEEAREQQKTYYDDQVKTMVDVNTAVLAFFNSAMDYKHQLDELRKDLSCTQSSFIAIQSSVIRRESDIQAARDASASQINDLLLEVRDLKLLCGQLSASIVEGTANARVVYSCDEASVNDGTEAARSLSGSAHPCSAEALSQDSIGQLIDSTSYETITDSRSSCISILSDSEGMDLNEVSRELQCFSSDIECQHRLNSSSSVQANSGVDILLSRTAILKQLLLGPCMAAAPVVVITQTEWGIEDVFREVSARRMMSLPSQSSFKSEELAFGGFGTQSSPRRPSRPSPTTAALSCCSSHSEISISSLDQSLSGDNLSSPSYSSDDIPSLLSIPIINDTVEEEEVSAILKEVPGERRMLSMASSSSSADTTVSSIQGNLSFVEAELDACFLELCKLSLPEIYELGVGDSSEEEMEEVEEEEEMRVVPSVHEVRLFPLLQDAG